MRCSTLRSMDFPLSVELPHESYAAPAIAHRENRAGAHHRMQLRPYPVFFACSQPRQSCGSHAIVHLRDLPPPLLGLPQDREAASGCGRAWSLRGRSAQWSLGSVVIGSLGLETAGFRERGTRNATLGLAPSFQDSDAAAPRSAPESARRAGRASRRTRGCSRQPAPRDCCN